MAPPTLKDIRDQIAEAGFSVSVRPLDKPVTTSSWLDIALDDSRCLKISRDRSAADLRWAIRLTRLGDFPGGGGLGQQTSTLVRLVHPSYVTPLTLALAHLLESSEAPGYTTIPDAQTLVQDMIGSLRAAREPRPPTPALEVTGNLAGQFNTELGDWGITLTRPALRMLRTALDLTMRRCGEPLPLTVYLDNSTYLKLDLGPSLGEAGDVSPTVEIALNRLGEELTYTLVEVTAALPATIDHLDHVLRTAAHVPRTGELPLAVEQLYACLRNHQNPLTEAQKNAIEAVNQLVDTLPHLTDPSAVAMTTNTINQVATALRTSLTTKP